MVKTRIRSHKRVFTWFASRRPQTPAEASLEASLEIQRPQGAGRPCYEADNSACRGEWRRETGSPRKGARLMPVRERESGELPSPICPCSTARLGRDLLFSQILLVLRPRNRNRKNRARFQHRTSNTQHQFTKTPPNQLNFIGCSRLAVRCFPIEKNTCRAPHSAQFGFTKLTKKNLWDARPRNPKMSRGKWCGTLQRRAVIVWCQKLTAA